MTVPSPKPWVLDIAPYIPGRSKTDGGHPVAKLSANENPLGSSAHARAAFADAAADLQLYPDPSAAALREAIAAAHDLDPLRVLCGTGSGELLYLAANAYAGPGDEVIYVRYGFSLYDIAIRRVGATPVVAPDRDGATDVDAILACVTDRTTLVYVANPNNPTGTYAPRAEIARLHAALPGHVLLVLDQAYAEYVDGDDDGGLDLAHSAGNVLVTRTFSKIHGLAAERVGWGYGPAAVIDALHRIRGPFNVTAAGQAAAVAAVADTGFVERSRAHNLHWRNWFEGEIASLGNAGLSCVPSQANFSLVRFEGPVTAEAAFNGLLARGYIVRWLPGQGLPDALRITIGSETEMRGLAAALREIIG